MGGPINIKGVTSDLTRHYGGGELDSKKRFLDSKGYSQAFKKTFKTSDLNKVKQLFKEAGIKTNRFSTSQKIKEKDFLKDLKLAVKAGIIKDSKLAKEQFRRGQIKENHDLTFKEKRSFNILSGNTKRRIIWGAKKENLSHGAKIAAEEQKVRDQNLRKMSDVGIEGFETMEKEGDSTLWQRYKALNSLRYRNEEARAKLKEISMQINLIRLQAKKNPEILRNYGIPEIQRSKSVWKSKKFLGSKGVKAKEDPKFETDMYGNVVGEEEEKQQQEDKTSQRSISITHSAGSSAPAGIPEADKGEIPVVPFSIVRGSKNFAKEVESLPENEIKSEGAVSSTEIQEEPKEQEYGFIDQDEGDVKLG